MYLLGGSLKAGLEAALLLSGGPAAAPTAATPAAAADPGKLPSVGESVANLTPLAVGGEWALRGLIAMAPMRFTTLLLSANPRLRGHASAEALFLLSTASF